MRKWIFAVAIALLASVVASSPAVAQGRGGEGMRQRMMEMMFKDITLTDAQKAQVDSIQAKYQKEMPAFTPRAAAFGCRSGEADGAHAEAA